MKRANSVVKRIYSSLLAFCLVFVACATPAFAADKKAQVITAQPLVKYVENTNDSFQLTPNVLPADATDKELRYESSHPNLLEVSDTGLVTVKGDISTLGEHDLVALISIKPKNDTNFKGLPGLCFVLKGKPLTGITVKADMPKSIKAGEEFDINEYVVPKNPDASMPVLLFGCKDPGVLTQTEDGTIRGRSPGKTTITVQSLEGTKTEIPIEVTGTKVTGLSVKREIKLTVGDTYTLTPQLQPKNPSNQRVYFFTDDDELATITPTVPGDQKNPDRDINDIIDQIGDIEDLEDIDWEELFKDPAIKNLVKKIEKIITDAKLIEVLKDVDLEKLIENGDIDPSALFPFFDLKSIINLQGDSLGEYTEGPLTIKAHRPGTFEIYLTTEDGEFEETVTVTIEKKGQITDSTTETTGAQTGDGNLVALFASLTLCSAAVALGVKRRFIKK